MFQLITAIMKDPQDKTVCYLLFANQVTSSDTITRCTWFESVIYTTQ